MKIYFAMIVACVALVGVNTTYMNAKTYNNAKATPLESGIHVQITGNDDGHCHYCGPKKCPYFRAKSGSDPTTCKCGHSKRSHVDSYQEIHAYLTEMKMIYKSYRQLLSLVFLAGLLSSCSAEKKPTPPQGYLYCGYCQGTGYEYCYLDGLVSKECFACSGSGYGQDPNYHYGSPSFRGSSHEHIDKHVPWNECDICGKHKVYW